MAFLKKEQALAELSQSTIGHYDEHARGYWEGTKDHDVSQNYQALLQALPRDRRLTILDLGCGPGRDLKYFSALGHEAIGLDGSRQFCEMARAYTGCELWQQDFHRLDLPRERFDGIFANASLFHVRRAELLRVLQELRGSLKPSGILFSSNPRGAGEGFSGDARYGNYMEFPQYQGYLEQAGFVVLNHYYRPAGRPRAEQPWLAVVSQKAP